VAARVRRDEDDPIGVGFRDPGHDLAEDRGVLADEIQPRLARLLAGTSRDHRDSGTRTVRVRACPDAHRPGEGHGVLEVHCLALGAPFVGVHQDDLGREPRQEQRVGE
jgi:hypothetical protein